MSETREHEATTIANVDMAREWDGDEGDDWTENADRYDATDRWIWARFEAEVEVDVSDEVLDVGCGTGKSTRATAHRASSGSVLGIDLSSRMLDHARRQSEAEGLTNARYIQGDAQVHPFDPQTFDLAISAFGAMFFADPVAAFANIASGLRRGGRLALVAWQPFLENEWLTAIFGAVAAGRDLPVPASGEPGPFGLAEPERVRQVLGDAGLAHTAIGAINEPFWAGADEGDAWSFIADMGIVRGLTDDLDEHERRRAFDNLRKVIAQHVTGDGVLFDSAAWLITAKRP